MKKKRSLFFTLPTYIGEAMPILKFIAPITSGQKIFANF